MDQVSLRHTAPTTSTDADIMFSCCSMEGGKILDRKKKENNTSLTFKMKPQSSNLQHLFVQQGRHGVRHDVVLEGTRRQQHRTLGQLFGELPQGTTPTVDLNREKR